MERPAKRRRAMQECNSPRDAVDSARKWSSPKFPLGNGIYRGLRVRKMAHPEFWRGLMNWATELSETASLHLNKTHTAVELRDVSYKMRQNLESLTTRAGQI